MGKSDPRLGCKLSGCGWLTERRNVCQFGFSDGVNDVTMGVVAALIVKRQQHIRGSYLELRVSRRAVMAMTPCATGSRGTMCVSEKTTDMLGALSRG